MTQHGIVWHDMQWYTIVKVHVFCHNVMLCNHMLGCVLRAAGSLCGDVICACSMEALKRSVAMSCALLCGVVMYPMVCDVLFGALSC